MDSAGHLQAQAPLDLSSRISIFVAAIEKQMIANEAIYHRFLPIATLIEITKDLSKRFYKNSEFVQVIQMLVDFLGYCKNQAVGSNIFQTTFTEDFIKQLAERWLKLQKTSYFYNKSHLKVLSYIVSKPKKGELEYGNSFQSLKFDLSIDEVKAVAQTVKKMFKEDARAFIFLSNYFYSCFVALDEKNTAVSEIQAKYLQVLKVICQLHPPAAHIFDSDVDSNQPADIQLKDLYPKLELHYDGSDGLDEFIMERARDAVSQSDAFKKLVKGICQKNGGFRFKSGPKISSKEQKALLRVKEKMLIGVYKQTQLRSRISSLNIGPANSNSLSDYIAQDLEDCRQKIDQIFKKTKNPIKFSVMDMLRGKCAFTSVKMIKQCCEQISKEIENRKDSGIKLVAIKNRLKKQTSDLVMKIRLGDTIAELQLVKDAETAQYEFGHKLYELQRCIFFDPLTQLSMLNKEISKKYFSEIRKMIEKNKNYEDDYEEKVTFKEVDESFLDFFNNLKIQNKLQMFDSQGLNSKSIEEEEKRFKKIEQIKLIEENSNETKIFDIYDNRLNNGIYLFHFKRHAQAAKELQLALKQFQKQNNDLLKDLRNGVIRNTPESQIKVKKYIANLYSIGSNYSEMKIISQEGKNCPKAVQFFQQELKLEQTIYGKESLEVASTLLNIGTAYVNQGNYPKALDFYKQNLKITRKKGKESEVANILNNIGIVYFKQENYQNALDSYQEALKTKGRDIIDEASTIENIGVVYLSLNKYRVALQQFQKALEIKQKVKGKDSIDFANILNSIGVVNYRLQDYRKALDCYQQALKIRQNIKGFDSIEVADSYNNIGIIHQCQNLFSKAHESYKKALNITEQIKGKDSTDVADILNNIGAVFQKQRQYQKALYPYMKARKIRDNIKGDRTKLACTLNNIANVYKHMDNYSEALKHYGQALEIRTSIYGEKSIEVACTYSNIGDFYQVQRHYGDAFKSYERAIDIGFQTQCNDSMQLANMFNNIGVFYQSRQKYSDARKLFQKRLAIIQNKNGSNNLEAASAHYNIGVIYDCQEVYPKAFEHYQKALKIRQQVYGNGIEIVKTLNCIGLTLYNSSKYPSALQYHKRAREIIQKIKGNDNKDMAETLVQIGNAFYCSRNSSEAIVNYEQSIAIYDKLKVKENDDEWYGIAVQNLNSLRKR